MHIKYICIYASALYSYVHKHMCLQCIHVCTHTYMYMHAYTLWSQGQYLVKHLTRTPDDLHHCITIYVTKDNQHAAFSKNKNVRNAYILNRG